MNSKNQLKQKNKMTLTEQVTSSLRKDILSGLLKPGMKLPTEPQLTEKFGVSRTVVREAIASLKAEGLVKPRQGAGVLILGPHQQNGSVFEFDNSQISDVLEILELRMAVEIEATSLACERCSIAQQAKIYEALQKMVRQIASGEAAVEADYEFHRAIAIATNNSRYVEFLDYLGKKIIPRAQLRLKPLQEEEQTDYMSQILDEHQRIYEAISHRNAKDARRAMRDHLSRSQKRYQNYLTD